MLAGGKSGAYRHLCQLIDDPSDKYYIFKYYPGSVDVSYYP
ncbi:unnamed protein product, partial [marine sediment metagenome]